jgi:Transposase DDE domain
MPGVFVKTTRVRRGNKSYEYLSLVEAHREGGKVGHRLLFRLGEAAALRASGELDRIIGALSAHAAGRWLPADRVAAESAPALGSVAAVEVVWRRLGLDRWFASRGERRGAEVLADASFAMVANRLIDPCSKRRLPEWVEGDVTMPTGFLPPAPQQYYRALDAVADSKEATETELYTALCDLANMDLTLVCYDLTSTYFEGDRRPSERFPSKAFGYSRDHRSDRPQVVLGLLCTTDGLPIAHHVFAGNTADVTTLPTVLGDLAARFGVGRVCVVADRGLISADNVDVVAGHGFDHVLATRLHRDPTCRQAVEASAAPTATWVPVPAANSAACDVTLADGRRAVIVASFERHQRDTVRTAELVARTEAKLSALQWRVHDGELVDAGKIGRAAQRILGASPVARLFDIDIAEGYFLYHYNDDAFAYEALLAGRYVLTTSLTPTDATTAQVVAIYRQLQAVEHRFRVLKDFLHLRPVRHWTETRVRGHIAVCVYAAVIEALIEQALATADVRDPDLPDQHLTAARALRELHRVRTVTLTAGDHTIDAVTRRDPLQQAICTALGIDTTSWNHARPR